MARQGGLIQDQNFNAHFDVAPLGAKSNISKAPLVVAPLGAKSNISKAQNQRGLGGRKALNDISNSGRPSMIKTSKKQNSSNAISLGEDIDPSKLKSFGGRTKASKAPVKVQVSGERKALSDLTNSGKSHVHQGSKVNHVKKLIAVLEEQIHPHIAEEQFLHNHTECIKGQTKAVDMHYFLETIGLANDNSTQICSPLMCPLSRKFKHESSPKRYLEMEEMPELVFEDRSQWKKTEMPSEQNPGENLKSPKPVMQWSNYPEFMLMETPKVRKQ